MEDRITIKDIRLAISKKCCCVDGARLFLENIGYGWKKFLKEGIEISELRKLNDCIANKIIDIHLESKNGRG